MNESTQVNYLKPYNSVKSRHEHIIYVQQTTTFYPIFSGHLGSSFKCGCISFIKDFTQDISNSLQ